MNDTTGLASLELERLLSLIEFAKECARLKTRPVSTVAQHRNFALHEEELAHRPGIHLNRGGVDEADEIWLSVERLHETKAPPVEAPLLKPWVSMSRGPDLEPTLHPSVPALALIEAGTHRPADLVEDNTAERTRIPIDTRSAVTLSEYEQAQQVRDAFTSYLDKWQPWAEEEKKRRWTIRLYGDLFTLRQQLEGSIVESPIEIVWGVGLGIWNHPEAGPASYPLVTRPVEVTLNLKTQNIEVRPRAAEPMMELDWYASIDNVGVPEVEKVAREFFGESTVTFSPFDRGSYEPLLKAGVVHLDANGVYWPNVVSSEDRMRPKAESNLRVTDTWVLFARPRSNSVLIQDLQNLKERIEERKDISRISPAVAGLVRDPSTATEDIELPTFRGVSASCVRNEDTSGGKHKEPRDLFFPKPFNDEQLRIVQLLETHDGVVVQGPPGTGKTHTIANVICHYLASGQRVLVTSMKDHALSVLQEQLPEEIRSLTIALLTSEADGLRQFENAIRKIASGVQTLDKAAYRREIEHLEDRINALHGHLLRVDRTIAEWAEKNLGKICLDGSEIDPQDAAREVVEGAQRFEWLPDPLGIQQEFEPKFTDTEIRALRAARRELGADIAYLGVSLPQVAALPDAKRFLSAHQALSRFALLRRVEDSGEVIPIADSSPETLAAAKELLAEVESLRTIRNEVIDAKKQWSMSLRDTLRAGSSQNLLEMLEALGQELQGVDDDRKASLARPVIAPNGAELDSVISDAVTNLAEGKSAFGLSGLFGKAKAKRSLARITLLGRAPEGSEGWAQVAHHFALARRLRALAVRWNALAPELRIESVPDAEPHGGVAAAEHYAHYLKVKACVFAERRLVDTAKRVFPEWIRATDAGTDQGALQELEQALSHHLTKERLAGAWSVRESTLAQLGNNGSPVVERLRTFIHETIGNPDILDAEVQTQWQALTTELARALALKTRLLTVADVTQKVEASGAPLLAKALCAPLESATDPYLPDDWRRAWRLRRLATHLKTIDAQEVLKKLSLERAGHERDLASAYQKVVVKRTWLRLAEKASPSIRTALQAYLGAIKRIGKGTGKRAIRYRQDARSAARQANPAVPCWILGHHRVSESLPPEVGDFDLVIIDEASQSDLSALPALLRGKKFLIVGDDKQVSPDGVGLEEEKVRNLMTRFLGSQVEAYRTMMSPERSIYDLCSVVFANSGCMLREHFRCAPPIIEYSKREFYDHELRPLRVPKCSERLDPPLVDVFVEDGYRTNDTNKAEAQFIVEEIGRLIRDPRMQGRSIGVVSLLGSEQAFHIWQRLSREYGPDVLEQFKVACGDARTFQGKERNVMFLSMVHAANHPGMALTRDAFSQRFNVAASRAKDRMYLVRSVRPQDLSERDVLRRNLIQHFSTPFFQDEERVADLRDLCESPFEREVYDVLTGKGYWVTPQVRVGRYRIDMVVEGDNDRRLAIECDGDKYHGPEKWGSDMQRQRVLERAGWVFWRCFASTFIRRREEMIEELVKVLELRGIEPIGADRAPRSVHCEFRTYQVHSEEGDKTEPAGDLADRQSDVVDQDPECAAA